MYAQRNTMLLLKTTRLLLVGVAMAALVLMGFAPPTLAQSTQQEVSPSKPLGQLPQPTKLETKPLPPDAKGPAGGAANSASIVASEDPEGNLYVAEELIVAFEPNATTAEEERVKKAVGGRLAEDLSKIDAEVLSFPEVKDERTKEARQNALKQKKQALERDPNIESVSYNYLRETSFVPNDPHFTGGYQWGLQRIGATGAWDKAYGSGARVAVLDTGIDTGHPDIRNKVAWQWDFFYGDSVANVDYGHYASGHGTHVAGTVGASTNNGYGVAGTAPGSQIIAAKVCGPWRVGDTADDVNGVAIRCPDDVVMSALNYFAPRASSWGIKAANLSLGGPNAYYPSQYESSVNYAWNSGIVVVVAGGNNAQKGNPVEYPAAFPRAIAVAATNSNDYWANFSNVKSYVDVAAPGVNILSTTPGGRVDYMNGTSMAAPHVSGLAALLASRGLNKEWIRYRIEATATDLGSAGWDPYYGYGRINAQRAVTW